MGAGMAGSSGGIGQGGGPGNAAGWGQGGGNGGGAGYGVGQGGFKSRPVNKSLMFYAESSLKNVPGLSTEHYTIIMEGIISGNIDSLEDLYQRAHKISPELSSAVVATAREYGLEDELTALGGGGGGGGKHSSDLGIDNLGFDGEGASKRNSLVSTSHRQEGASSAKLYRNYSQCAIRLWQVGLLVL